jgi:excisionase family DNA binding protein
MLRHASSAAALEWLRTIRQTADLLQVSEKTIRRSIADGSLPAHRIGAQWRICQRDIEDFLRTARGGTHARRLAGSKTWPDSLATPAARRRGSRRADRGSARATTLPRHRERRSEV